MCSPETHPVPTMPTPRLFIIHLRELAWGPKEGRKARSAPLAPPDVTAIRFGWIMIVRSSREEEVRNEAEELVPVSADHSGLLLRASPDSRSLYRARAARECFAGVLPAKRAQVGARDCGREVR